MEEIWRIIPSCPEYEVSSFGKIRNEKTKRVLKIALVKRNNYITAQVSLLTGGRKSGHPLTKRVSRLVCEAFHGPKDSSFHAAHINGKSTDNRAENLYWATPKENIHDQIRHGTFATSWNGRKQIKITLPIVNKAIELRKLGFSWKNLQAEMGISSSSIRWGIKRYYPNY